MAVSLSISLSQGSQSVANNTTVVSASVYATATRGSYNANSKPGTLVLDGTSYSFSHSFSKGTTTTLCTKSKTVTHNSDGSKTVSASASYTTGVSSGTITASKSLTLSRIPRVSDLSVDKTSVPIDASTTVTATATKKSSSFTDTITVTFGSYSQTVTSGTAFTIPKTWMNNIPKATSGTATVTVTTKSGSTTIGSKSTNITLTVPSTEVPSISSISATEANTAISAVSSKFIQGYSKLNVAVNAAGVYGSTISSYSTTINSVKYNTSSFQTEALATAGTVTISSTVTDSRGRTKSLSKTITVSKYEFPKITSVGYTFASGKYTLAVSSNYYAIFTTAGSLSCKYKQIDATTYTAGSSVATSSTTAGADSTNNLTAGTSLTESNTYNFIVTLFDGFNTVTYSLSNAQPVISRYAGGDGVTLFGEAEAKGFKVAGGQDSTFTGDIFIEDSELETLYKSVFG